MAQRRNTAGSLRSCLCFYKTHQVSSHSVKPLRRYSLRSIFSCFSANSLVWYSRTLGKIDLNSITFCQHGLFGESILVRIETNFHFVAYGSKVISISKLNFWTSGGAREFELETPNLVWILLRVSSISVPNFTTFP